MTQKTQLFILTGQIRPNHRDFLWLRNEEINAQSD